MGIGGGVFTNIFDLIRDNPELAAKLRAEQAAKIRAEGGTPLGEDPVRTQGVYTQPTQTSQYANPIPQYMPARFNATPYAQAYQQQFSQIMPQMEQSFPQLGIPQIPATASGLGALAQLYGMYNPIAETSDAQSSLAPSIAAAANTDI